MPEFEWDEDKNRRNTKKHKVNFEEAKTIFDDPSAIEFEASRNGEYRIIRIGKSATKFILLVVYTIRGIVVRLISARQANKEERNLYIEEKFKNQDDGSSNG
ncbi:MAG TPA: BrnT family toxin [Saprospiraceae bacterium]|nr:BrnT family toxin [Saprospiraceae bacterium]HMP26048.1 BrnT family toxin [Saprospiraceae bacterium]